MEFAWPYRSRVDAWSAAALVSFGSDGPLWRRGADGEQHNQALCLRKALPLHGQCLPTGDRRHSSNEQAVEEQCKVNIDRRTTAVWAEAQTAVVSALAPKPRIKECC